MKKIKAFYCKFQNVSFKDKVFLIIKIMCRLLGIKTYLLLGGYYQEDDDLQSRQDQKLYMEFLMKREKNYPVYSRRTIDIEEKEGIAYIDYLKKENINSIEKIKVILDRKNTYVALMAERLDRGGLEEVIKTLAIEYHKRNLPIEIFCTREGGKIAEELKKIGIKVIIFHGNSKKFRKYIKNNAPVLVNTHYVIDFMEILKYNGIPVVEVIHNMYVFLDKKRIRMEREKSSFINQYIAVSEMAKQLFIDKIIEVPNDKITVIGNAVNSNRMVKKKKEEIRHQYKFDQDCFIFLVAGSIDARKNQIGIVRAWDIFRQLVEEPVMLILAGATSDYEYEKKVRNIIESRKLEQSVRLLGYCNEIFDLMNAADALIVDSYYEGWSVAATEAIYLGLPIIHSRCGSGVELTADGQNGILINNPLKNIAQYNNIKLLNIMRTGINDNMKEMVSAMLDLYDNRSAWKQKRMSISNYARDHINIDNMIEKYVHIYLDTIVSKENYEVTSK